MQFSVPTDRAERARRGSARSHLFEPLRGEGKWDGSSRRPFAPRSGANSLDRWKIFYILTLYYGLFSIYFNIQYHSCPKSIFFLKAGGRDVLATAYFGPEAGQPKGQTIAVSGAMDGVANEVERISRLAAALRISDNLNKRT